MGLPLDAYRNLWTTLVHYDRLIAVTPAVMGATAGSIAPLMANVTFGGPDLKTVYLGSLRGRPPTASPSRTAPGHWYVVLLLITVYALMLAPGIIAGQVDMVPVGGSDVLPQGVIERPAQLAQCLDRLFYVDGVAENDRSGEELVTSLTYPQM